MKNKKIQTAEIIPASPWLRINAAAAYSKLAVKTIRKLSYSGDLPCYKPGKRGKPGKICYYNVNDLDTLMQKGKLKVTGFEEGRAR